MNLKKCSKCGEEKKNEEFVKDKRYEDGTRSYCKTCENLSRRKTPIKPTAKEGYKICSKCYNELPLNEFNKRTINGSEKRFSYCITCERKYNREKYKHKCSDCGKEYKSGKKTSKKCKSCHSLDLANIGRKSLKKLNLKQHGKNNPMYGIRRFGKKNPNYNPNKTDEEREKGRLFEGYGVWRKSVYERDNFTCICCGYEKGAILTAHHLNSWDWCKKERLDVNNGVTLCEPCHISFHSEFGFGKNTKEQFEQFFNQRKQYVNTEVNYQIAKG